MLLNWSSAVTLTLIAVPAVATPGAETTKCVAIPDETVTVFEVPVIVAVTVSVPVIVWLPSVFKVTESVLVPLISVTFAGRIAAPSVLVKCTEPV
jgi:hypothetical protein